jgi:hypothetical protein
MFSIKNKLFSKENSFLEIIFEFNNLNLLFLGTGIALGIPKEKKHEFTN